MNECVFCQIVTKKTSAYVVYEDIDTIAFLDKFPQSKGHIQLIPRKHYRWIYDIEDIGNFFTTAQNIIHAIIPILGADHVTLGTFGNQIAHAHLWIVPQYRHSLKIAEGQGIQATHMTMTALAQNLRLNLMKEVQHITEL